MSRLAAVPPDEDPGEREAERELGCVQELGAPAGVQVGAESLHQPSVKIRASVL